MRWIFFFFSFLQICDVGRWYSGIVIGSERSFTSFLYMSAFALSDLCSPVKGFGDHLYNEKRKKKRI